MMYRGFQIIFKENAKLIHQSISLFYYRDKYIDLSYRILEISSQFQLLMALTILECYKAKTSNALIFVFIIVNSIILLILKMFYKINEAIYRFKRVPAFISQLILIVFLMLPNLTIFIFYLLKITMLSEKYLIAIILLGNIIMSQVLIEPFTIACRIICYRLIATSLKNKDMNPIYHLIHFFVMHSSLEEIFEEFTRIQSKIIILFLQKCYFTNYILFILEQCHKLSQKQYNFVQQSIIKTIIKFLKQINNKISIIEVSMFYEQIGNIEKQQKVQLTQRKILLGSIIDSNQGQQKIPYNQFDSLLS